MAIYRFVVLIERTTRNYAAWVPDLPGCVATGETRAELEANIESAFRSHVAGLIEDGKDIPEPTGFTEVSWKTD